MHRSAELLLHRRLGIIRRLLTIIRRIAVGAPMPLIGAGRRVVDNDAAVAVAIGDVDLVGRLVDRGLGGLAELGGVITAGARRDLADLHHELAVEGEFQKHVVVVGVAADPDKAALVDLDAVLAADPFVAVTGSAPGAQQIAVGVEFQDRWRRHAAFRARRVQRDALFVLGQRSRALDHPDMSLPVDGNAADLTHDPVVGQLFRPGRIDRKGRDVAGVGGARGRGRGDQDTCRDADGKNAGKACSSPMAAMLRRFHGVLPRFCGCDFFRLREINRAEGGESIAGGCARWLLHKQSSSPAKAGDPARRGFSIQ